MTDRPDQIPTSQSALRNKRRRARLAEGRHIVAVEITAAFLDRAQDCGVFTDSRIMPASRDHDPNALREFVKFLAEIGLRLFERRARKEAEAARANLERPIARGEVPPSR